MTRTRAFTSSLLQAAAAPLVAQQLQIRRGFAIDIFQESDYNDDEDGEGQFEKDIMEFGDLADVGGTNPWYGSRMVRDRSCFYLLK